VKPAPRAVLTVLALLALAGCSLDGPLARRAAALVAASRPTALDCSRADHCALDSPFAPFAEAARQGSAPDAPLHYVDVIERGEDALLLRIHLIRAARRSIDIQTFIWAEDDAGWLMLDELVAAARRGVRVRVLADQLFAPGDPRWLARIARAHANLELRLYNPAFHRAVTEPLEFAAGLVCCFTRFNQRMHNKLFLVDGEIGIAGGRNVEDRYFDWDPDFDYRDRDVLVIGPSSGAQMETSFERFWNHRRSVPLTLLNDVNVALLADAGHAGGPEAPAGVDLARVYSLRARAADAALVRSTFAARLLPVARVDYFSDAPDKQSATGESADPGARIAGLIAGAKREIAFETPYLVLSPRARTLFRALHQRDPPVTVLVSTNSLAATDAFYVYALSYKYKKRYIKRYGFQIHEFKPFPADAADFVAHYDELAGDTGAGRFERYGRAPLARAGVRLGLHAKSLVVDGRTSVIGSHNFDPRSDDYNTESGFIIDDAAVAARVREAILRDAAPRNAWTIARRERPRLLGRLNELVADLSTALPLFDLWPFRYATSYELRPGCAPQPPASPGFHACYRDVGDFPEVDLPLKTIYTRIVTAFGAGLAGIL
jgi:cardiolipin synthase C